MQLAGLKPAGSLRFSQYDQAIRAAIEGQGVALGTSPLVRELIQQGRLVAPLAKKFESSRAYYLVASADAAERPEVKDFAGWLLRQAKQELKAGAFVAVSRVILSFEHEGTCRYGMARRAVK